MKQLKSRLIKTAIEIAHMKKANEISSRIHQFIMSQSVVGLTEASVNRALKNYMKRTDAKEWSYSNIVGSGQRATILHAKPTSKILKSDELVLIDVGVKYKSWCSDVTRTFPVGRKFTSRQKEIYSIVLEVQKELIVMVKPGLTLQDIHDECAKRLEEKLVRRKIIKSGEIKSVFPHKTSHWIGIHVHDECPYFDENKQAIKLQEGMVFTVEPGLYFNDKSSKYFGIGVRIEDVVVVRQNGCEVLSSAPKEVAEIEMLRSIKAG